MLSTCYSSSLSFSDDLKSRGRTDVRIPKDNSLMVEGHHYGGRADEHKQEERAAWEQKELFSPSTVSVDSGRSSISLKTKGMFSFFPQTRRKVSYNMLFLAVCRTRVIHELSLMASLLH